MCKYSDEIQETQQTFMHIGKHKEAGRNARANNARGFKDSKRKRYRYSVQGESRKSAGATSPLSMKRFKSPSFPDIRIDGAVRSQKNMKVALETLEAVFTHL
jgi:hypothetical protein